MTKTAGPQGDGVGSKTRRDEDLGRSRKSASHKPYLSSLGAGSQKRSVPMTYSSVCWCTPALGMEKDYGDGAATRRGKTQVLMRLVEADESYIYTYIYIYIYKSQTDLPS
jgi:hypothetical protein